MGGGSGHPLEVVGGALLLFEFVPGGADDADGAAEFFGGGVGVDLGDEVDDVTVRREGSEDHVPRTFQGPLGDALSTSPTCSGAA